MYMTIQPTRLPINWFVSFILNVLPKFIFVGHTYNHVTTWQFLTPSSCSLAQYTPFLNLHPYMRLLEYDIIIYPWFVRHNTGYEIYHEPIPEMPILFCATHIGVNTTAFGLKIKHPSWCNNVLECRCYCHTEVYAIIIHFWLVEIRHQWQYLTHQFITTCIVTHMLWNTFFKYDNWSLQKLNAKEELRSRTAKVSGRKKLGFVRWPIRDMRYSLAFQTFSMNFTWIHVSFLRFQHAHMLAFHIIHSETTE